MAKKISEMSVGEDGAVDHHGDRLPTLSKSASKLKYERLLEIPPPNFDSEIPGSPFYSYFAYFMMRRTMTFQYRTIDSSGLENIPDDSGSLCCSWHTNGILDPLSIMLYHPKWFVIGGRHDLVYRPILGFWGRKLALQPVIRQAELIRGGCTKEDAQNLNGRSLLNLANGIAHGWVCALFPEGTSHNESHMIRLRSGPMRTILAAGALAKGQGLKIPSIQPVGLHFRVRHHWRTDVWVEFGKPINIDAEGIGDEMVTTLMNGEWKEPEADSVNKLRETLKDSLSYYLPTAPSWKIYRAWKLLGHIESSTTGNKPTCWKEEVLAARIVRERLMIESEPERESQASEVAEILDAVGLDGRDIDTDGKFRRGSPIKGAANVIWMLSSLCLLPIFLLSCGLQAFFGFTLGNKTDEGLDARSNYQFLFGLLGTLIIWPIIALAVISILWIIDISWINSVFSRSYSDSIFGIIMYFIIGILSLFLIFWVVAKITLRGWDALTDSRRAFARNKLRKSADGSRVRELCDALMESTSGKGVDSSG